MILIKLNTFSTYCIIKWPLFQAFFRSSASLPSKTRNCFAHSFIHSFVENYFCFFTVKIVSHSFNCRACTSKTDSTMKGTCYTQSECTSKSGTSGGNCAAGKLNEYLKMSFFSIEKPMLLSWLNLESFFISRLWSLLHVHVKSLPKNFKRFLTLLFSLKINF